MNTQVTLKASFDTGESDKMVGSLLLALEGQGGTEFLINNHQGEPLPPPPRALSAWGNTFYLWEIRNSPKLAVEPLVGCLALHPKMQTASQDFAMFPTQICPSTWNSRRSDKCSREPLMAQGSVS